MTNHAAPASDAAARLTPGAGLVVVVLLSLGLWAVIFISRSDPLARSKAFSRAQSATVARCPRR